MTPSTLVDSIHLCIATGGTGGHYYPALAVAREFQRAGRVTMLLAGRHAVEQMEMSQSYGIEAMVTSALRLPGLHPVGAAAFPFRFVRAWFQARALIRKLRPSVFLGMGSFASAPPVMAAVSRGIPLVLHEGNTLVGRANRFFARWAEAMAVSFPPDQVRGASRCRRVYTGFPVRSELVAAAEISAEPSAEYLAACGLQPGVPTLLAFGGSQGATFLNRTVPAAIQLLGNDTARRFQFLHFTGTDANAELMDTYAGCGLRACVKRAETAMHHAYSAAGLVICRAGASTITELALFGRPALLIPLPSAAEDHQTVNAEMAARTGGAHLCRQAECSPLAVADTVREWLSTPDLYRNMGQRLRTIAKPDAAAQVVRLVCDTAAARPADHAARQRS